MLKKYHRYIAYFTICLLCCNAGLSLAAAYSAGVSLDDGSERILLCTAQGYKWVTIDKASGNILGQSDVSSDIVNHIDGAVTHHDCPFCHLAIYAIDDALDNTALSMALAPRFNVIERYSLSHVRALSFYPSLYRLSRAPPFFS